MRLSCWCLILLSLAPGPLVRGPLLSSAVASEHPNVLFIAADDLRCDLESYGHPLVQTPNLDRLAARGTQFDRAYCAQAVCNPSRSSLLTGRRPNTLQQYNLSKHFREAIPEVVTLPQHFKQNGYFTQDVGKIFHNWVTDIHGDPVSWSVPAVMHYARHGDDKPQVEGELPPNLASDIKCECRDVPDEAYFDGRIASLAIQALRERAQDDQPFFLAVGFWKPHLPFNAPKGYWDLYQRDKIPGPPCPQWPEGTPRIAWHNSQELLGKNPRNLTEEAAQELRHGYLAAISYMDAQVGRVVDELERLKLADDTLIVFWSDHGFQLGDHTLWAKTSNFENDARVPLIIVPPASQRSGTVSNTDAIVELLDLYPTLSEYCGLPAPEGQEGVSLKPLIDGSVDSVKPAALTQHPRPSYYGKDKGMKAMGHSVRTPRYRYTAWRNPDDKALIGEELYDHDRDGIESVNRVDDPEYRKELPRLRQLLDSMAGEGVKTQ
ncbi:sulfatase [Roseiconus nitratireducens]|uniref:Sulfatase n=1 Tax=Roseiconus nitratireducens TaxID=2605748 RepID=A0A5M6DHK2_9BACT|nr:sulfatase [Roseiconus nitratireducens]KAA5547027.1 sulfatase [Roseiconus nitratireducens]